MNQIQEIQSTSSVSKEQAMRLCASDAEKFHQGICTQVFLHKEMSSVQLSSLSVFPTRFLNVISFSTIDASISAGCRLYDNKSILSTFLHDDIFRMDDALKAERARLKEAYKSGLKKWRDKMLSHAPKNIEPSSYADELGLDIFELVQFSEDTAKFLNGLFEFNTDRDALIQKIPPRIATEVDKLQEEIKSVIGKLLLP